MARYLGGAIIVELGLGGNNNRDQVDMKMEGDVELVFGQEERVVQVRVAGGRPWTSDSMNLGRRL
jgi:hypothetical protein